MGRQEGGLVLGFGLMLGLPLVLEGNARVFNGPPLIEVQAEVLSSSSDQGGGTPPRGPPASTTVTS